MIVPQLQKILECGDSGVDALCALTDEFRGSREALELIEALDSESDEIVCVVSASSRFVIAFLLYFEEGISLRM